MLVPVLIDPASFCDSTTSDIAISSALHRRTIQSLLRSGVVVVPNDESFNTLGRSIADLPQAIREYWMAALPRILKRMTPDVSLDFDEDGLPMLRPELSSKVKLVACGELIQQLLQLKFANENCEPNVEYTRLELLSDSNSFRTAELLLSTDIAKGDSRTSVWKERFEDLANSSRTATIVDRYALKEAARHRTSGVAWVAKQLDRSSVTHLTLVVGAKSDEENESARDLIRRALTGAEIGFGTLRKVTCIVCRDQAFYSAHGRYIRFGETHCILVEPGFDVFRTNTMRQTFPCPSVDVSAQLERERELRSQRINTFDLKFA